MKWNAWSLMASLHTSGRTSGQDAYEYSTKTDFFSSPMLGTLPFVQLCELNWHGAPPSP